MVHAGKGDAMKIVTDHKWKDFVYFTDLTNKEKKELDWIIYKDYASIIRYRGNVYALDEFVRTEGIEELSDWHGYAADTFFSGIVIKVSDDGEQYMIGRYCS